MRLNFARNCRVAAAGALLLLMTVGTEAQGGAPSSIQIFMPGGGLPDRVIRFELTRDDGRIETLFTDNKGKFQITGDLVREADYIVRVNGDGRSFASTVVNFRTFRNIVIYVPVFLNSTICRPSIVVATRRFRFQYFAAAVNDDLLIGPARLEHRISGGHLTGIYLHLRQQHGLKVGGGDDDRIGPIWN